MKRTTVLRACYGWLLGRAAPSLSPADIDAAYDDFERLRADARRVSFTRRLSFWSREAAALARTWRDERRRRSRLHPAHTAGRATHAVADDVRQAARSLVRQPTFVAIVIATLALGIGANAATLTLLDRLLIRGPADVVNASRLVRVYRRIARPVGAETSAWLPYQTYRRIAERSRVFTDTGVYGVRDTIIGRGTTARNGRVGMVLGDFFGTLGSRPATGRFFERGEDASVQGMLAVLSDRLWRTDFDASAQAIGGTLLVDGAPAVIVGIAPPGFSGAEIGQVDAWVLGDTRTAAAYNWKLVGRLREGVSVAEAADEIARIHTQVSDDEPKWIGDATLLAAPIHFDDSGRESTDVQIARWLAGVAAMILIVTCANVANLLIVRLAKRRRELGIRIALGSGRARVVRLIAFEGVLLAAAGAIVSVVVTFIALTIASRAFGSAEGAWTTATLDGRLTVITTGLAVAAAFAIALLPAFHAALHPPGAVLRDRTDAGPARTRLRAVLTVVQAAISLVLLAGAGLFLVSLRHVAATSLGTEPGRVLVVELRLQRRPVPADAAAFQRFLDDLRSRESVAYRRALDAIRHAAGVENAAIALGLPLDTGGFTASLDVPGVAKIPVLPGGGPYISAVGDGYFSTIGTRILRGRPFTTADGRGSEPVAIVSATTAARLWPEQDPLSRCLHVGRGGRARVVGVAEDVHRNGLRDEPSLQVYVPFGQEPDFAGARLLVRPLRASPISIAALRQASASASSGIDFADIYRLSDSLESEMRPLRVGMMTFGISAALAVVTASLGLYGLMTYVVAWRRREIGIRRALGATDLAIRRLVAGSGVMLAAAGVAAGLAFTVAAGKWIQPQLFETSASDPRVLAGASAILVVVAVVSGAVTTGRALRISPAESLRAE